MKQLTNATYGKEHTLNNIGLVYAQVNEFIQALEHFEQGLAVAEKNGNIELIIYSQNNIGNIHLEKREIDKAEMYFKSSLKLAEKVDNANWESVALTGMAQVHIYKKQFETAEYFLDQSFQLRSKIKDQQGLAEIYFLKANLLLAQNYSDDAFKYLDKSDSIARKIKAKSLILEIYESRAKLYEQIGNIILANEYRKDFIALRDTLYQDVVSRNLSLVPAKIFEGESRMKLQESEIALKEKDLQNLVYISLLILVTPFSILMILIFQRNKKINSTLKKQNDQVEAQKEEIETQKEYLESNFKELERAKNVISKQKDELQILNLQLAGTVSARTIELQKVNERLRTTSLELDNFIYKSSHDIKGPIVSIMGICNLAMTDIHDEQALAYFAMLDKAAMRLNIIIDELKLISELSEVELKNTAIDFPPIVHESLNEAAYIENIKDFKLNLKIQEELLFYSDEALIRLIVFNLMQNSLQFMKSEQLKNCKIGVHIHQKKGSLLIEFQLFGLQLLDTESLKILNSFSKAQEEYENLSIGLYTVNQCIYKLQGKFNMRVNKKKNTIFEVVLPLSFTDELIEQKL